MGGSSENDTRHSVRADGRFESFCSADIILRIEFQGVVRLVFQSALVQKEARADVLLTEKKR